ncbi:RIP metalloprotease RseP [Candidatus Tenderia electrophaga]|jgi:regulator of sigma E protease|uniref:Zinc metalloprotease n=1 Tax=Candidatus Tenderia electrophaga TaxID=1748243 RepID=A0A0S2TD90_9GAMM|nr:RIP metalloprotease RseP [Candidatus Tenderia electrophaga]
MGTILSSVFFFIVALGILVTVHEFGHFWVARKAGVKVLRFSVGFGKPLWSKTAGPDQIEYVIAAIPLGGYVRMLDEREGEVAPHELHRAFNRQPLGKRFAVVLAGPLFNFILAIIAYWLIFVLGVTGMKPIVGTVAEDSIAAQGGMQAGDRIVAVGGRETPTWSVVVVSMLEHALDSGEVVMRVAPAQSDAETQRVIRFDKIPEDLNRGGLLDFIGIRPYRPLIPALIGKLAPNGAAERAGLEVGDRVVAADGEAIKDWEQWVDYVRARPEQTINVGVERDGERINLDLTPARVEGDVGKIGAGVRLQELPEELKSEVRYGPAEALLSATVKTWDMSILTLRMLGKMVTGDVSLSNLSGPLSIARYAGYSASAGFVSFLTFLAVVSISLGVLNLLPVPMLDGGHLMYYIVEFFKGSPVSDAAQITGQKIGIALLLGMMLLAFYNDILRFFVS